MMRLVYNQANSIASSEVKGLPSQYYVSAHLLRVVKLVNKLIKRENLHFLNYLYDLSYSQKALDHIDGVVKVESISVHDWTGRWHVSRRSKLLDITSDKGKPSSSLCRRLFTNRNHKGRPLDAYVCNWVSKSIVYTMLPWKRTVSQNGKIIQYVLDLSDESSPLDHAIWFTVEDKRFQILLHGSRAVRNRLAKRVGSNKRLEQTPTTEITANDTPRQMNQTSCVRTQVETIDSVKKLMIEASKFETEPSCPGGLEF